MAKHCHQQNKRKTNILIKNQKLTETAQVRVPEDTPAWKDILHVAARDADANSKLVFSIQSSANPISSKLFHLDPKSGVLATTDKLDYETIPLHILVVMVTSTLHYKLSIL